MAGDIEIRGLAEFQSGLASAQWDSELRDAHGDIGKEVVEKAKQRAGGIGGAAPLTASTLMAASSSREVKVSASAPYAAGSEYGSSGGNPSTRQFSNVPGQNKGDGYWFNPAFDDDADRIVERFGKAVDDIARPAFPD